ncbi:MAG: copper ion binding protein, partial [Rhodospirillales bacterium]|nr:copper ion binding protein [Rhodospirillales bacterium]
MPDALARKEAPDTLKETPDNAEDRHLTLAIEGMTCASCVARIEGAIKKLSGVRAVAVNLATEKADVEYDPAQVTPTGVAAAIRKAGYEVPPATLDLAIEGMTCASCVSRVEKGLAAVAGVTEVAVNLATETARVKFRAGEAAVSDLLRAVEKAGYKATLAPAASEITDEEQKIRDRVRREAWTFWMSALLTLPFVVHMVGGLTGVHAFPFPAWIQLGLASVVQFGAGARFYGPAWRALRAGTGNMDLLVALGTLAAYGLSVWLMFRAVPAGPDELYFEAATVVITLILLGKWLETRAKHSTTAAVRALMKLRPETARIVKGGVEIEIPAEAVASGEIVVVRPGERLAVDGVVIEGASEVDESLITGESLPVAKAKGDKVTGGAINGSGLLHIRATTVGQQSTVARIIALIQGAQASKAPIQHFVDRVSAVFVPVVVVIAAVTAAGWLIAGASVE